MMKMRLRRMVAVIPSLRKRLVCWSCFLVWVGIIYYGKEVVRGFARSNCVGL